MSFKEQYEFEKESALKLLSANRNQRKTLYTEVYTEFYNRYPHHREAERTESKELQFKLLEPFIDGSTRFLEIGGGNLTLSKEIAKLAKEVISIEASEHEDSLLKRLSLKVISTLTSTQHPFRPMEQIVLIAYK